MSKFLFDVQQKNRLEQKGLLRRFSITCYGHQESVEEIRAHKAEKYKEIKQKGDKKEMEEWFLNYKPDDIKNRKIEKFEKNKKMDKKRKRKVGTKKNKKGLLAIYGGKTRRKY
jgi:phosphoketolase